MLRNGSNIPTLPSLELKNIWTILLRMGIFVVINPNSCLLRMGIFIFVENESIQYVTGGEVYPAQVIYSRAFLEVYIWKELIFMTLSRLCNTWSSYIILSLASKRCIKVRNTILPCLVGFNHMFDVSGCGLTSLGAEMLCFCLYCCVLYLKETCMVYTTKGFVH